MLLSADIKNEIFKDLQPSWKKILLSSKIKPLLNKCLIALDQDLKNKGVTLKLIQENGLDTYIRPKTSKIFEAFKYFDINNLKVIILGQDPYTQPSQACGLSFSVPNNIKIPPSLKNIYKCLYEQKLIDNIPKHGCLDNWAKQGILLLNRNLTRTPNICKNSDSQIYINGNGDSKKIFLHDFWGDFIQELLIFICTTFISEYSNHKNNKLVILLWGNKAQNINLSNISKNCIMLKWGHPSPLSRVNNDKQSDKNFIYCNHFTKTNEILKKTNHDIINWDPNWKPKYNLCDQFYIMRKSKDNIKLYIDDLIDNKKIGKLYLYSDHLSKECTYINKVNKSSIVCFTDGGCLNNGTRNAKASYGIYFPNIWNNILNFINKEQSGIVEPYQYIMNNDELINDKNTIVTPTNNRGELLAILYALIIIINNYKKYKIKKSILIISDSTLMCNTINSWIYNWVKVDFKKRKNIDMLIILWSLMKKIKTILPKNGYFKLEHQRAHLKKIPIKGSYEYYKYLGNTKADQLCSNILHT